ncbi:MAG: hypothetical protein HOV86_01460 [Thermoactinospora sp.]|nr:hypothetical protein [Thermoactinospora sp.]
MSLLTFQVLGEGDANSPTLREWLAADEDLRRRIKLAPPGHEPGKLGPVADVVQVVLQHADVLTPTVIAVLVWLRGMRGTISVDVKNDKRSMKITAQRVRGLSGNSITELAREITRSLDEE